MMTPVFGLHAAILTLALLATLCRTSTTYGSLRYANHIFNAIHSSMRQFGSSLNHNGMSIFIATVPEGIELYHGTSSPYRVNGTEWLAFEPEHALIFARPHRGPPGPRKPPRSLPDTKRCSSPDRPLHNMPPSAPLKHMSDQKPILSEEACQISEPNGYLHTYRTKHDLRLLYLDGQSAAKSRKGTLDMQDKVLLQDDLAIDDEESEPGHGGPMGEFKRASGLCRMAYEQWNDRIDGILRMEGGFEIILCSFEQHLNVARITQSKSGSDGGFGGHGDAEESFNYYQAVAARYDGIGGNRVRLGYDTFVTLFARPNSFAFDETGRPRVSDDTSELDAVRTAVTDMILQEHKPKADWQAISDLVVARYADRIEYMVAGDWILNSLKADVDRALRPFIDYAHRNSTAEIERCASQFMPPDFDSATLAARAILNVTSAICTALTTAAASEHLDSALMSVRDLKSWLGWTTWKRCRGCGAHEICFLPIWPVGSENDFKEPKCRSNIDEAPKGYWGDFGPPHKDESPDPYR